MNTNSINSIINIFRKRSLVTIAGRPAMGKTTMILGIISELCRNKKKCLYITDTEKERITSAILKLNANLQDNEDIVIQSEKIIQSAKRIDAWTFHIYSTQIFKFKDIKQLIEKNLPDFVIIDFYNLNKLPLKSLKVIANNQDLAIIVTTTIKRKEINENQYPSLLDLKTSNIEKYSDEVLLLYRESYYNLNISETKLKEIEIIKAKSKEKPIKLNFCPEIWEEVIGLRKKYYSNKIVTL